MKSLKLIIITILSFVLNSSAKSWSEYRALVDRYKSIDIESSPNFKTKLTNTVSKLQLITEIKNSVETDNIFYHNSNINIYNQDQGSISILLWQNQLNLQQIKTIQTNLDNSLRYMKRVEFIYDFKDNIIKKIDAARKITTQVGDYASGAVIAYGLYNLYFKPLNYSFMDFISQPHLISESQSELTHKAAMILAMVAISSHYIGS